MINNNTILNYETFLEKLNSMKDDGATTKQILEELYLYFKDYVTYNYD